MAPAGFRNPALRQTLRHLMQQHGPDAVVNAAMAEREALAPTNKQTTEPA